MKIKKIAIVGGGTAGLIAATILKRRFDIVVDIIFSEKIGIIGVGEGSTEHFKEYIDFVGIRQYDLIQKCNATYKSGIMFEGWGENPYLHSVVPVFDKNFSQYSYVYARQISKNQDYFNYKTIWNSKINKWFLNREEEYPFFQFHFDTYKLNEFLLNFSSELGVGLIKDDIVDVRLSDDGSIDKIIGNKSTYDYDFYIDATGFNKILIGKMGAKWCSFGKYLKMNSAITFQTPDEENYNLWTLSKAMDAGWLFRIPTWGRYGNGYIFDDRYIDVNQAQQEVQKHFNREIEIGKKFNFDPGYLEAPWIKNCCAIGLSGSFVEPLEATSIGTSIQQSFLLMHRLINYDESIIKSYNKSFKSIMENIRDFIVLHYITKKNNTLFWRDIKNIALPDSLEYNLNLWKNKLPINEDFHNSSDYILFKSKNFILVMAGLELFDREKILQEYNQNYQYVKDDAENTIDQLITFENTIKTIKHKDMIKFIRNLI